MEDDFPFQNGDFSGFILVLAERTPKQTILEASLPKNNTAPENRLCFKPKQSPNHCSLSSLYAVYISFILSL